MYICIFFYKMLGSGFFSKISIFIFLGCVNIKTNKQTLFFKIKNKKVKISFSVLLCPHFQKRNLHWGNKWCKRKSSNVYLGGRFHPQPTQWPCYRHNHITQFHILRLWSKWEKHPIPRSIPVVTVTVTEPEVIPC